MNMSSTLGAISNAEVVIHSPGHTHSRWHGHYAIYYNAVWDAELFMTWALLISEYNSHIFCVRGYAIISALLYRGCL